MLYLNFYFHWTWWYLHINVKLYRTNSAKNCRIWHCLLKVTNKKSMNLLNLDCQRSALWCEVTLARRISLCHSIQTLNYRHLFTMHMSCLTHHYQPRYDGKKTQSHTREIYNICQTGMYKITWNTWIILTSPHLPTTSSKSKRPNDRSTMHLLTALLLLSGVRSSSAISTHPSDLTANLIGRSEPFDSDGSARAG